LHNKYTAEIIIIIIIEFVQRHMVITLEALEWSIFVSSAAATPEEGRAFERYNVG